MKKVLIGIAIVCAVILSGVGFIWYSAFSHNRPITDGETLAPGVQTVQDGFVSAFVLDVAPGKVALIDAGHDKEAKAILAALSRRSMGPDAVVAIFLTHGHPDHTAGCKQFPNAKVYAMQDDVELVGAAATVTGILQDGDVTEIDHLKVESFAVPGHTPGSAVFLADGVLFFGDSAGASKDGSMMPAVKLFSKNADENVASVKRLAARLRPRASEIHTLAFAHAGPLQGFGPLEAFASTAR